jgi:hypothetical protein
MDWLNENLGKFAPVALFIMYMLSALKGRKQSDDKEPDPGAAQRAPTIQEVLRHRILDQQRGEPGPTARPPETIAFYGQEEAQITLRPDAVRSAVKPVAPDTRTLTADHVDPYEERRHQLEAQLKEAKRMKLLAKEKAKSILKSAAPKVTHRRALSHGEIRKRLTAGLADRDSLKTAILLREVLDTPLGLR